MQVAILGQTQEGVGPNPMSVGAMAWAWKQKCSPATKTVLLALADHADDDGICWPGRKGLAGKIGITPRNITRHLAILTKLGIIESVKRLRDDGSRTSNLYRLVGVSILTGGMDDTDQGVWIIPTRGMDDTDQTGTIREPSIEEPSPPPSPPPQKRNTEIDEDFRIRMKARYPDLSDLDERIEEALAHSSAAKYKDQQAYVRGWLRRDTERNGGQRSSKQSASRETVRMEGWDSGKW